MMEGDYLTREVSPHDQPNAKRGGANQHFITRIGWMRAAVLGANDGIVSTASLILGVASSGAMKSAIIVAGTAGLVAGALSMAVGEYVSVSSQADTERADLAREKLSCEPVPNRSTRS
jgi:VIT1/CCC1 family predicted Fe2+/Mn2+ transporter